jgi:hypothetical protein
VGGIVLVVRLSVLFLRGAIAKCGVFFKWEDCLASVANFDKAVFFGADSLDEAKLL